MFLAKRSRMRTVTDFSSNIIGKIILLNDAIIDKHSFVDYLGVKLDDGLSWTDKAEDGIHGFFKYLGFEKSSNIPQHGSILI